MCNQIVHQLVMQDWSCWSPIVIKTSTITKSKNISDVLEGLVFAIAHGGYLVYTQKNTLNSTTQKRGCK